MKKIQYTIISYDPENCGLSATAKNVVDDFLGLFGMKKPVDTIECNGNDELICVWNSLGAWRKSDDTGFRRKMRAIYRKTCAQREESTMSKVLLVTSIGVGDIVGLSNGWIAIISSNKISRDAATIATAIYHELGHIHNIPSKKRNSIDNDETANINDKKIIGLEKEHQGKNAIFYCLGEHCLNRDCSMRQRICFDNWKKHLTTERLRAGKPYCDRCLADLKYNIKNNSA